MREGMSSGPQASTIGSRRNETRATPALNINIVSALSLAFTKCYSVAGEEREGRRSRYVSLFTREAIELLREIYSCDKIRFYLNREIEPRLEATKELLESSGGWNVFVLEMKTRTRLLVHSRNPVFPLPYISLAWDPILNVPIIPSSSLKGVARFYLETRNPGEFSAETLFGSTESRGFVIFTDAYPVGCNNALIEPDVITPHYRELEDKIHETSVSPTPIVFVTVAPGTVFRSILAIKSCGMKADSLFKIVNMIRDALERGVGAKTSVGYGRIEFIST